MILVDASVWIDHIRNEDQGLRKLLKARQVLVHPFVIGELALGRIRDQDAFLLDIGRLPAAIVARTDEVLEMIRHHDLVGRGIGYVDAHLLASARLLSETRIWTRDKRLAAAARHLGVSETLH